MSAETNNSTTATHHITKRAVFSWALYDLANTIFSMGVISLYFPFWVRSNVGENRADAVFGTVMAASMAVIFLASPVLGAMTDKTSRRMPFLAASTLVCVLLTTLLGRFDFIITLILFGVANIAYQAGIQFYDALLPDVSTETNRGKIGGIGVGIGYFGSYIAVGLGLVFGTNDRIFLFTMIALAFLVFALPCMVFVKERGNPNPVPINLKTVISSLRKTIRTLASTKQCPGLLRFLIGRVFYTDAINTVIGVMSLFTINVAVNSGLNTQAGERQAQVIMMCSITFAIVGGFLWGWVTDRLGPKRTLNYVLWSWLCIFAAAAAVGLMKLPLWTMYIVGATTGFCLGGVWAADRPFMLRLTPPDRVGEFYGLYGMVGRFSAVTGPLVWAVITHTLINKFGLEPIKAQSMAILALLLLVGLGFQILSPVSDKGIDHNSEYPYITGTTRKFNQSK
ncbi:MAG: MFS transporter [Verrucomicrobia bacterium]|nr:MFS transporter [Verrucomicrobiota bacterium]